MKKPTKTTTRQKHARTITGGELAAVSGAEGGGVIIVQNAVEAPLENVGFKSF